MRARLQAGRRGFTLVELLVVIIIIGIVSALTIPVVAPALSHRQVSEAGRILQGALVGARDRAIHEGQPSGIRLIPDPSFDSIRPATLPDGSANPRAGWLDPSKPLAYSRIIPIGPAPEYREGAVTVRPSGTSYAARVHAPDGDPTNSGVMVPSLVLEEAPDASDGAPNAPTSWAWNVRVGDRVRIRDSGPWYTVCGPMWTPNPEGFVNWGPMGTASPLGPEWLILVNGRDDDRDGYVDNGFDGVDNDGDGATDEYICKVGNLANRAGEWEPESWNGSIADGVPSMPYTIRRRPMPQPGAREVSLPTHVVIDADPARSALPYNLMGGTVDIMVNPDGTAYPALPYGTPSSLGLSGAFLDFGMVARADVGTGKPPVEDWSVLTLNARSGLTSVRDQGP